MMFIMCLYGVPQYNVGDPPPKALLSISKYKYTRNGNIVLILSLDCFLGMLTLTGHTLGTKSPFDVG